MKHPFLLPLALPLALAAIACSPRDPPDAPAPADGSLAAEARGHAANQPDAAPSPPGRPPAPDLSATLAGHHWRLESASAADGGRIGALSGNPDAPLQLDFGDGRVSVTNACNAMSADFTLDAGELVLGPMASTRRACAGPLMAMEREAHARLAGSHQLHLEPGDPPRLRLVNARGDTLVFGGVPTARTRYGSEPERVFLEVAAERIECQHPPMPGHRCLRVRELRYDDRGLARGAGEWGPLYAEIEGFEHRPGTRSVLRLDRYRRQDVPADASSVAYVLDMVVETGPATAGD